MTVDRELRFRDEAMPGGWLNLVRARIGRGRDEAKEGSESKQKRAVIQHQAHTLREIGLIGPFFLPSQLLFEERCLLPPGQKSPISSAFVSHTGGSREHTTR